MCPTGKLARRRSVEMRAYDAGRIDIEAYEGPVAQRPSLGNTARREQAVERSHGVLVIGE